MLVAGPNNGKPSKTLDEGERKKTAKARLCGQEQGQDRASTHIAGDAGTSRRHGRHPRVLSFVGEGKQGEVGGSSSKDLV